MPDHYILLAISDAELIGVILRLKSLSGIC